MQRSPRRPRVVPHWLGLATSLCMGCSDPEQPPLHGRLGTLAPNVTLQTSEGCARFQVRFVAGSPPTIEETYGSQACSNTTLKLFSDTVATFDAATGSLRIAIRIKYQGTAAVIPRVELFFNADSTKRFNANGSTVPGTSDIVGYQPDSSGNAGRRAYWWYDAYLAPSGQPPVVAPGDTSERRWIEFRGTTWTAHVRLKLL